jgi:hypothetical protein
VRHGYPWVPTDQTHDRPRQVGLTYQKSRQPNSGPNRPSWRYTQPPEDLLGDSKRPYPKRLRDLACKTRQWIPTKQIDGYGKCCNQLDLGLLVWETTLSTSKYKAGRATPCINHAILKQSTPTTGRRVLLSGGPN